MAFSKLKRNLLALELLDDEEEPVNFDSVEVYADSLEQALQIAAHELKASLADLDYEILEKGSPGILGLGRLPYKVKVKIMPGTDSGRWSDLEDLNFSLTSADSVAAAEREAKINLSQDGKFMARIYKNGCFLTVHPPKGDGKPTALPMVLAKIRKVGILNFDEKKVQKAVEKPEGKQIKIAEWVPKPEADSTMSVELSNDEMKAFVTVTAPRPGGRHLQANEIINALKVSGVEYGFKEEKIQDALDSDKYGQPITAAEGDHAEDGQDGYVDYKVRIEKKIEFKEDESGRVDFLAKDLIENVVQGQVLAELMPAKKGKNGKTVTNKYMPAKDGRPAELRPGKGTIVSDDGNRIIAERNGQVVFVSGKLNVEEIYTVGGDVGLDTGNIMFLGSVVVRGSVSDNMEVKAAGNIDIGGNVGKSRVEAEGDIVIRSGIMGRDEAVIESTTGSVYAKFIQNAKVSVEKDVVISEGLMHSKIDAAGKVVCNGKRAQIVGGEIMAGEEIRCKQLGAQASTPTTVIVGINPKILQQIKQIEKIENQAKEKLDKIEQNIRTLNVQKKSTTVEFSPEKEEMLEKMVHAEEKLKERLEEATYEKDQLREYMDTLATHGKIHVEKTLFPGVTVEINNARLAIRDEYQHVTLIEDKGNIKIVPYQKEKDKDKITFPEKGDDT
ncbi:MAG: FapA family protein [Spirochaetia bacterium]|nr:FapA family protein [Spirochaetia bacterium]